MAQFPMLKPSLLFARYLTKNETTAAQPILLIAPVWSPLQLDVLKTGIDNVHIDVFLDPHFCRHTVSLIDALLEERTTTKRRFNDQPSAEVQQQLDHFNEACSSLLVTSIYQAKQSDGMVRVQLLELSLLKFILEKVKSRAEQLLQDLRNRLLATSSTDKNTQQSYERSVWINNNYNRLLQKITSDLFNQIYWAEMAEPRTLRQNLFGQPWSLSIDLLSNPVLQSDNWQDHDLLTTHYVLISQDIDSIYGYNCLSESIDSWLMLIGEIISLEQQAPTETPVLANWQGQLLKFSWRDVPENIEALFNAEATLQQLQETPDQAKLKDLLLNQQKALKLLAELVQQAGIASHILAAYETPVLFENYARLLKPYVLYQGLCGDISVDQVWNKLQIAEKTRPLRRATDKALTKIPLQEALKRVNRQQKQMPNTVLYRFIHDFVTYRRDLKQRHLLHHEMARFHLLSAENDVRLSRANYLLYEFLEQTPEQPQHDSIRCHVILKADVRGSTTITSELRKRGLNPATHFSRTFFNPIRQFIETFGAEKVFIEGDAVILSVFEYALQPKHWLSVARACGLARSMLAVVEAQNRFSIEHHLPVLELGLGICYAESAPDFLYDGDQRIMISPAIGDADRLSSCSWKLRRHFANQPNLLTRVMVFQQSANDRFKGEKGITTFRYNLNGIELDSAGFAKLCSEMALKQIKLKLPDDKHSSNFFVGHYTDMHDNGHQVVVRQGQVSIWQENSLQFMPTDAVYYEVVTHPRLLKAFKA